MWLNWIFKFCSVRQFWHPYWWQHSVEFLADHKQLTHLPSLMGVLDVIGYLITHHGYNNRCLYSKGSWTQDSILILCITFLRASSDTYDLKWYASYTIYCHAAVVMRMNTNIISACWSFIHYLSLYIKFTTACWSVLASISFVYCMRWNVEASRLVVSNYICNNTTSLLFAY
jgi:hypothetical protein